MDIIPRTPSPVPLTRRDPNTVDAEGVAELQRQVLELQVRLFL
jgi:hypothetical protein